MEGARRSGSPDLTNIEKLAQDPQAFHIFQAIRIIEAEYDDRPRLGITPRPRQDAVRFSQEAEPAFPTSTIVDFEPQNGELPGHLTNRFFGLFGPNGPLPLHLTEYARDRARNNHDTTFVAFANTFTHRMMSLLYRAWATGQPTASFDRKDDDPFRDQMAAISGHLGNAMRDRDAMPDLAKHYFAAHLGRGAKSVEGLLAMISSYFSAPVKVEDFIGSWLRLEPEDQWQLGQKTGLGQGIGVGSNVWSRNSKFRVIIGPLPIDEFRRILPGGVTFARLKSLVRNYVGDVFDWDINVILRKEDIPDPILGQSTALGQTCWIGNYTADKDPDDLYLSPHG